MVEGIEPRVKLILLSASPIRDILSLASGQALDRKLMEERSISDYAEETRSLEPKRDPSKIPDTQKGKNFQRSD